MKGCVSAILFMLLGSTVFSQRVAEGMHWFYLKEKDLQKYAVHEPGQYLSERSIQRRAWQGLPVTTSDIPVNAVYLDSIRSMGAKIKHVSRWLNGVLVESSDSMLLDQILQLTFTDTVPWNPDREKVYYPTITATERFPGPEEYPVPYAYGYASPQIEQLNLDKLHEKGYTGRGVYIGILDGGFMKLPELPAFQIPLSNGQLLAERNYVDRNLSAFTSISHGTHVSSIIIGNWQDSLVGAAPDASVLLALTENAASETRVEEYAWIEAAEWADSIGVDVLNTSLGYTVFDDPSTNYTYADMDGKTAHISIANSMCAAKGIISVTSAGNSGNDPWHYIGAPADATNILSVGAVDEYEELAGFSSRGPTYDHRIKPEVSAMGFLTAYQSVNGEIQKGFGTSYSSPMIAGATAVLWQAYPHLSATELMRYIIESGDRAEMPDTMYGYGIPDFLKSFYKITAINELVSPLTAKVYPNPCSGYIFIDPPDQETSAYYLQVMDMSGRTIMTGMKQLPGRVELPDHMETGVYFLRLTADDREYICRIVKVND